MSASRPAYRNWTARPGAIYRILLIMFAAFLMPVVVIQDASIRLIWVITDLVLLGIAIGWERRAERRHRLGRDQLDEFYRRHR